MSGLALGDEALVAGNEGFEGFLYLPLADIAPSLATNGGLLGSLRGRPSLGPVISELLEEGGFD